MNFTELTLTEACDLLHQRKVSSMELTLSFLNLIDKLDSKIGAFITKTPELAVKMAKEADKRFAENKASDIPTLCGVPVAIKDILSTKDVQTTCASKILIGFVPPFESTPTERLFSQGAVLLGKTNMDEFGMGSSTENSAFFPCRNPWDLARVPGGSSGGSAAAVVSRMAPGSLGTDTGGSIRQPAAHTGVVGIKPTYGRVSRYGLIAFASSLDQVGPIARTVKDCAILLNAISGYDPKDATSLDIPVPDFSKACGKSVKDIRAGIPEECFSEGLDFEIRKNITEAIKVFESMGMRTVPVKLPNLPYVVATYYVIAPAEASSNLARYDGVRYGYRIQGINDLAEMYSKTRINGFGAEVKRRIMIGTFALSSGYYDAYYLRASQVRSLIKRDFEEAFRSCDVILMPTTPEPAFLIGEREADPLSMYLSDIFTIPANLAGLPAMSVPAGFTENGLPVGLQIMAPALKEEVIFSVAYALESELQLYRRVPDINRILGI